MNQQTQRSGCGNPNCPGCSHSKAVDSKIGVGIAKQGWSMICLLIPPQSRLCATVGLFKTSNKPEFAITAVLHPNRIYDALNHFITDHLKWMLEFDPAPFVLNYHGQELKLSFKDIHKDNYKALLGPLIQHNETEDFPIYQIIIEGISKPDDIDLSVPWRSAYFPPLESP